MTALEYIRSFGNRDFKKNFYCPHCVDRLWPEIMLPIDMGFEIAVSCPKCKAMYGARELEPFIGNKKELDALRHYLGFLTTEDQEFLDKVYFSQQVPMTYER